MAANKSEAAAALARAAADFIRAGLDEMPDDEREAYAAAVTAPGETELLVVCRIAEDPPFTVELDLIKGDTISPVFAVRRFTPHTVN